jgi:hypothetical protein
MSKSKYLGPLVLSLGLLLASALPGLAAQSEVVTLTHDVVLGGTQVPAGRYNVRWQTHSPQAAVQFVSKHVVVVSTEGRVEQRDKLYDHNAVVYNTADDGTRSLVEIRFAYSNKVLVFNSLTSDVKVARK